MKKGHLRERTWHGIVLLLVLLLLWECSYRAHFFNHCLWPSVSTLGQTFISMTLSGEFYTNLLATLARLFLGLFFGILLALGVGTVCIFSKKAASFLEPLIYLSLPVPRFVLLPFVIILFGLGWGGGVVFLSIGAFYPLVINMIEGFKGVDENYLDVARHYGATGWKLYRRVILPALLPAIFTGLRIGFGLTMMYAIVLEYLNMNTGLGAVMWMALQTLQIDRLCVAAITVALLNMVFTSLLSIIEKKLTPWACHRR